MKKSGGVVNMATVNLSIRIDANTKREAEELFDNLGMNISTAFNIFVKQSLRVRGIPFRISESSAEEKIERLYKESRRIAADPSIKAYDDVEEALQSLKS